MTIRILELYPDALSLNGDTGNRVALARRMRLAGLDVEESAHRLGDELPTAAPDVLLIGSGTSSALRQVAADVQASAGWLRHAVDDGAALVAAGGGFLLLSHGIALAGGERIDGAGVFDAEVDATADRIITEGFAIDTDHGLAVGTENHTTRVHLGAGATPFGTVRYGAGNGDGSEGVVVGAAIGTHMHGPLLPMNPAVSDAIIRGVADRRGLSYERTAEHDALDALTAATRRILLTKSGISE